MTARARTVDRAQSIGEEVANAISHGLGFLAAVAALPVLTHAAAQQGNLSAFSTLLGTAGQVAGKWQEYGGPRRDYVNGHGAWV